MAFGTEQGGLIPWNGTSVVVHEGVGILGVVTVQTTKIEPMIEFDVFVLVLEGFFGHVPFETVVAQRTFGCLPVGVQEQWALLAPNGLNVIQWFRWIPDVQFLRRCVDRRLAAGGEHEAQSNRREGQQNCANYITSTFHV